MIAIRDERNTKFTAQEKSDCAAREVKMRMRVYPRWVQDDRMSQAQANREIECMRQIAADYADAAAKERLL